jgi:hypothetical protein
MSAPRVVKPDPRVVGGRYFNGYWGLEYTVMAVEAVGWGLWLTVAWADGRVSRHCTAWDWKRDRIVSGS